jgi:hypothetical protein
MCVLIVDDLSPNRKALVTLLGTRATSCSSGPWS